MAIGLDHTPLALGRRVSRRGALSVLMVLSTLGGVGHHSPQITNAKTRTFSGGHKTNGKRKHARKRRSDNKWNKQSTVPEEGAQPVDPVESVDTVDPSGSPVAL